MAKLASFKSTFGGGGGQSKGSISDSAESEESDKADADAELYRAQQEAAANRARLTPEYLQLEAVRALANNTKVFWGDKLPAMYADGLSLVPSAGDKASPR